MLNRRLFVFERYNAAAQQSRRLRLEEFSGMVFMANMSLLLRNHLHFNAFEKEFLCLGKSMPNLVDVCASQLLNALLWSVEI